MTNLSVTGVVHSLHYFEREFWLTYKTLEAMTPPEKWNDTKMFLLKTKKIDDKCFENIDREQFEINKSLLDAEWKRKNEESKATGIAVHEMIRNELATDIFAARRDFGLEGDVQSNDVFLMSEGGLFPEQRMEIPLDEEFQLVGIADLISIKDGIVTIIDWKTDEDGIKFKSYYDVAKKHGKKLKYPLSKLDDINGVHYQLQLSIYMYMILKIRPDLKPGKLKIVWLKDKKVRKVYEVEYLEKEVEQLLKWYLKSTKLKIETEKCREKKYE